MSLDTFTRQETAYQKSENTGNHGAALPAALPIRAGVRGKTYFLQNKPAAASCHTDPVRKKPLFAKQMAVLARLSRRIGSCGFISDTGVFHVGTLAGWQPEVLVVTQFDFPGVI